MPARSLCALLTVLALVVGCGGGEDERSARLLDEASFKEVVAGAVRRDAKLEAEPGFALKIRVVDEENWVELDLGDAYARYRREPERRDEIVRTLLEEAERRVRRGIDGESFTSVRKDLMPLLKPIFAVRRLAETPAQRAFPGSLVVTYAVQREDAFFLVSPEDLERWRRGVAEIDRIAVGNLARTTEELLCEEMLCGWASADGYDATRMIVPELRRDIVREIGPAAYAVPMEHVFVAVPLKYAGRIKQRVLRDFTTAENPVSPAVFVERNGELVVLEP